MTSETNNEYSNEELVLILKYGSLEEALFHWWGGNAKTDDELMEVQTLMNWQNSKKRDRKKVG